MPNGHGSDDGDPHLRSTTVVTGSHIKATDGEISHVENMLIDDVGWNILYFIVDTRNWRFGKHVLISPYAVKSISWSDHSIQLDVTRESVRTSPAWDPLAMIDKVYEKRLHKHYGWQGYGLKENAAYAVVEAWTFDAQQHERRECNRRDKATSHR